MRHTFEFTENFENVCFRDIECMCCSDRCADGAWMRFHANIAPRNIIREPLNFAFDSFSKGFDDCVIGIENGDVVIREPLDSGAFRPPSRGGLFMCPHFSPSPSLPL